MTTVFHARPYDTFIQIVSLESKGMRLIFRKRAKRGNISKNLDKNKQNLKIFCKRAGDCVELSHATNY